MRNTIQPRLYPKTIGQFACESIDLLHPYSFYADLRFFRARLPFYPAPNLRRHSESYEGLIGVPAFVRGEEPFEGLSSAAEGA